MKYLLYFLVYCLSLKIAQSQFEIKTYTIKATSIEKTALEELLERKFEVEVNNFRVRNNLKPLLTADILRPINRKHCEYLNQFNVSVIRKNDSLREAVSHYNYQYRYLKYLQLFNIVDRASNKNAELVQIGLPLAYDQSKTIDISKTIDMIIQSLMLSQQYRYAISDNYSHLTIMSTGILIIDNYTILTCSIMGID